MNKKSKLGRKNEKSAELVSQIVSLLEAAELSAEQSVLITSAVVGINYEAIINTAKEKLKDDKDMLNSYVRFVRKNIIKMVMKSIDFGEEFGFEDEKGGKK